MKTCAAKLESKMQQKGSVYEVLDFCIQENPMNLSVTLLVK